MDDIIERGAFMGVEIPAKKGLVQQVNPGLGLAVEKMHPFFKDILDKYATLSFLNTNGKLNQTTIVTYTTALLVKNGMRPNNGIQEVAGIWIYPCDYFNPFNDLTGKLKKTKNSRSIHWYSKTWENVHPWRIWLSRLSHRVFGTKINELRTSIGRYFRKKNI